MRAERFRACMPPTHTGGVPPNAPVRFPVLCMHCSCAGAVGQSDVLVGLRRFGISSFLAPPSLTISAPLLVAPGEMSRCLHGVVTCLHGVVTCLHGVVTCLHGVVTCLHGVVTCLHGVVTCLHGVVTRRTERPHRAGMALGGDRVPCPHDGRAAPRPLVDVRTLAMRAAGTGGHR